MKTQFPFEWLVGDGLMIVLAKINHKSTLRFMLDTGSSHTCSDKNMLIVDQINLKDTGGKVEIETANGWILADVFNIPTLEVLGLSLSDFPVQAIDFIEHGVLSNYAGVLGMDILTMKNLCIHFEEGYLTFE